MTTTPIRRTEAQGAPAEPYAVTVAALRERLAGRVATPADDDWDVVRRGWNLAVDQRPWAVVEAASTEDVRHAVGFAAERGLVVAAQPGGHGATRALDGVVLLRTRALDDVWVDTEARVARVGAGVKWGRLLATLEGSGLVGLVGSNPDVTVVGYLLGGGLSWFGRRYGYGAGSLRAVELVEPSGRHRWVTDESDPELMWALRGGGGDFGIVTAVEIDLYPAPRIYGGKLTFPIGDARAVLAAFAEVTRTAPPELTVWAGVMHFPPLPQLPEAVRGRSFVMVDATHLGEAAEAERLLAPLRAAGTVVADTLAEVDVSRLGEVAEEPTEPMPGVDWATLLRDLDAGTVDRLLEVAGRAADTPLLLVKLRHLGGALAAGSARPAVADRVEEPYLLYALGNPAVPGAAERLPHAFAALRDAVAEQSTDRTTFTFLGEHDRLARVYDAGALQRLRAAKRRIDPDDVVRSNHPVLRG